MAELPEITKLATQMNDTLAGKTIDTLTLLQEKCLNIPVDEFKNRAEGASIAGVTHKGKWIIKRLSNDEHILLSLGMGADVLYFENESDEQEKYQVKILFTDGCGFTARFWWFGNLFLTHKNDLADEQKTKDIAIDPFDKNFTPEYFNTLLAGKRTQIKSFLMNQKNMSGVGNMYMHDILWSAGLHPKRKISDMNQANIDRLYNSIKQVLNHSRSIGGCNYEKDFFGKEGGFAMEHFKVGYKDKNEPCPNCTEPIQTIKTGSTSSYICPICQKL